MVGEIEGKMRAGNSEMVRWHHWLNRHEFEKIWKIVNNREPGHAPGHVVTKSRT